MIGTMRSKVPYHFEDDESNDPSISTGMATIGVVNGEGTTTKAPEAPTISSARPNDGTSNGSPSVVMPTSCCFGRCNLCLTGRALENDTVYSGHERFQLRELSDAEDFHLKKALNDPFLQKKSRFSRVFEGPLDRLKHWPKYFKTTDASGSELKDGFVTLWTTFIVAESLLASVAMQPFITNVGNLTGWRLEVYGLLWMLALVFDYMGLAVTTIFLGYLHASPAKLTYMWLCNIGAWIGVPGVLVLLGTLLSIVAIAYTSWVVYGQRLGIICTDIEVFIASFAIAAATYLGKASQALQALK
ncbi:unnamed protein product [Calypogeia fissa]